MAQQRLCRIGTHEEERKDKHVENAQAGASNAAHGSVGVSADHTSPDRLTPFVLPRNFGVVIPGSVYRSSMPEPEQFRFLSSLKLKTILTLVSEWKPPYAEWIKEQGIRHIVVPVPANKDVVRIEPATILSALAVVLDRSNYPLLIHCNKGKHRTGCVVGCFRKIQGDSIEEAINEYHAYADPKARLLDEIFMTEFDERTLLWLAQENGHLPVDEPGSESPAITNTSTPVSRMRN